MSLENQIAPPREVPPVSISPVHATATEQPVFDLSNDRQRQVFDRLQQGFEAVTTEEGFKGWLRTLGKFHDYSLNNTILIAMQKPDATQVAGYRKWQELGRQVRKGETAIKIFVPYKRKVEDPDTGDVTHRVTGFGIGNVFDISSTDGEPLPDVPVLPEFPEVDERSREVNKRLSRWLIDEGVRLESVEMFGHKRGFYSPEKTLIAIKSSYDIDPETGEITASVDPLSVGKTKTLVHEATHYLNDDGKNGVDRTEAEVKAESTAFVVMDWAGFDTSAYSFPYAAIWSNGNQNLLRENLDAIRRSSQTLIHAIDGTPSSNTEDAL